jgi:post-segregation antitoxin (ccd killing protein)
MSTAKQRHRRRHRAQKTAEVVRRIQEAISQKNKRFQERRWRMEHSERNSPIEGYW